VVRPAALVLDAAAFSPRWQKRFTHSHPFVDALRTSAQLRQVDAPPCVAVAGRFGPKHLPAPLGGATIFAARGMLGAR
jgi:hypothetical protein